MLVAAASALDGVVSGSRLGEPQTPRLLIMVDASIDDSEVDLAILGLLKEKVQEVTAKSAE